MEKIKGGRDTGRLIPVKKSVIRKETGEAFQQTFYISPDEEKGTAKTKKPVQLTKEEHAQKTLKGETGSEGGGNEISEKLKDVKDFDDFGKLGIDPDAARTFFCRM